MLFKKKDKKINKNNNREAAPQAFIEKLGQLFSPEPQKEKVLRHEDFNKAGDTYYATVSVGYKITQRIILLILVIFLLITFVTNFSKITYDNFYYLIKDFSAASEGGMASSDILSYDSNTRHFFSLYKGGLTVVNPSNISVFTATGRKTYSTQSKFSSPCVESSDKYFMIYDTSGNTFSVYNSFARVFTKELEYPVTAAAFADNGYMAVITRDMTHKSLVHVYNKNFSLKYTVRSDKYAFDVAMDSERDKIAISYYSVGDGSGRTEIQIYNLVPTSKTHEPVNEIIIDGELVLDSGFLDKDRFAVITDRSVKIYDRLFGEYDAYTYDNGVISAFDISEHGVAVSYTLNSKSSVIVFDKSGDLLYNESVSDNVKGIGVIEGFVFLRTDTGVTRIDAKNLYDEEITCTQGTMLIYNTDTVLVCGDSKAEYLKFSE